MHPDQLYKFRASTMALTSVGAAYPTFMCARCHLPKRAAGRKKLGKGYICADCKSSKH